MNAPTPQDGNPPPTSRLTGLIWWTALVMAVIAVPLAGSLMALALSSSAFVQMIAFVLTCWACTWLGMWLVRRADGHEKKHRQ